MQNLCTVASHFCRQFN